MLFDKLDNSKHKMRCGCIKRTPTPHLVFLELTQVDPKVEAILLQRFSERITNGQSSVVEHSTECR